MKTIYDAIIIGAGPAGLNAAVVLGRCCRNVLVFDTGTQRNRQSKGMHNYLTRDDILPADFLELANAEIKKYGVKIIRAEIIMAEKNKQGLFVAKAANHHLYYSKKMLLATGMKDRIPAVPGIQEFYGKSVFHCPYCDAWELRDKHIGIYARRINGTPLSLSLKTWTPNVTLFTDGRVYLREPDKKILQQQRIKIVTEKIKRLEGKNGKLQHIVFDNETKQKCNALFFTNGAEPQSGLIERIGCSVNRRGIAITNRRQQTNIPGLYVAGDASKDMHFVVVAAGEGAKAGVHINQELQKEEQS